MFQSSFSRSVNPTSVCCCLFYRRTYYLRGVPVTGWCNLSCFGLWRKVFSGYLDIRKALRAMQQDARGSGRSLGVLFLGRPRCVCVYYCSNYYKAVRVGGGGGTREEPGTLTQARGAPPNNLLLLLLLLLLRIATPNRFKLVVA